jgi:hypothetical protein
MYTVVKCEYRFSLTLGVRGRWDECDPTDPIGIGCRVLRVDRRLHEPLPPRPALPDRTQPAGMRRTQKACVVEGLLLQAPVLR